VIKVTRFDGSQFWINENRLDFIEETPDTVVSMADGKKLLVKESAEEIVDRIIGYRVRVKERLLHGSGLPEYEKLPDQG